MKQEIRTYRLPFPDEVLDKRIKHGGDLYSAPLFKKVEIPLRNGGFSYGENRYLSFYFECVEDMPIVAVRTGKVIARKRSPHQRNLLIHATNYLLLDHGDGTYAKYVHVLSEVNKGAVIESGERLGMLGGYNQKYEPHLHLYLLARRWGIFPPWPTLRPIEICPEQTEAYLEELLG